MVFFTDTEEIAQYFRQLRTRYPASRTTVIVLKRDELWAFQLAKEIQAVYSQPGYPKHPPNTINPLYSCAMHAKFELVQRVILQQLYQTRYVAWLDIGLFRAEAKKTKTIHLTAPVDFDRQRVAYHQVNSFYNMPAKHVVWRNIVWVGGASFLATPEVAFVFCSEYRRAVRKLLDMKIMSTDQQVREVMYVCLHCTPARPCVCLCSNQSTCVYLSIGQLILLMFVLCLSCLSFDRSVDQFKFDA